MAVAGVGVAKRQGYGQRYSGSVRGRHVSASGSSANSSKPEARAVRDGPRLSATGSARLLPMSGNGRSFTSRTARLRRRPWPKISAPASPNSTGCSRPASVTGQSSLRFPAADCHLPGVRRGPAWQATACPRSGRISPRRTVRARQGLRRRRPALSGSSTAPARTTPGPSSSTRPRRPTGASNWQGSAPPTTRPPPRSPPPSPSTMPALTSSSGTAGPGTRKRSRGSAPSSWTRPYTRRGSRTRRAPCTGQIRRKSSSSGNCRRNR